MADQNIIDEGRLVVAVFIKGVATPAIGAKVRITASGDAKTIEQLQTNTSGQTPVISLKSPPVEYSLIFGSPMPYSKYDVYVTLENFDSVVVKGVQIFPNTSAYQIVELTPSVIKEQPASIIIIPEPTLFGNYPEKIPESPVKQLPTTDGFIVLKKPVVPEFIIVHDGVPNDKTAKNYKVPFQEYIKNVASSEIYSNWPESTIRANVLAILSFTLNRVYTEWYKSKGYNFTITNSTSFDQAFNYGRNIFQEISVIVDQIFTTFITKPNIRQPLFTQYCDGKNVTCPNWLSQWGSKSLGDKGYNTIDILKFYYGPEIYLMQAQKVEGIPSSFPGTNLQVGSTGENVRTIQTQLNAISKKYPAINKLKVDGIYGQATRQAVTTFQNIFGLPSTGIVDFGTWYKISFIFVSVEKLGPT